MEIRHYSIHNIVPKSQVFLALELLIGILLVAFGFWGQSRIVLFVGLLATVAGVVYGLVSMVTRSSE